MAAEAIKKALGNKSAQLIQDGMVVGLGTGTTAFFFVESLIQRCQQGLKIKAVASSEATSAQAKRGGIPLLDASDIISLDIYVDGADEVDPQNRLIKGRGGALFREKILATSAKKMVVIVDDSKLVKHLGNGKLPVEIVPFAYQSTIKRIKAAGYNGSLRQNGDIYVTDNQNYIFDIQPKEPFINPEKDHNILKGILGVVDTGFFFHLAIDVLIGYSSNKLEWRYG